MNKKQAQNSFSDGLVTDFHPLTAKNTTLTDALNSTIVTIRGNEMVLQNDLGNTKIGDKGEEAKLKEGFIPLGMKEYHGIIYIASVNPHTGEGELGSYPSPDYTKLQQQPSINKGTNSTVETKLPLLQKYQPLKNFITSKILKGDKLLHYEDLDPKQLHDLTTKAFNFSIHNPVDITVQPSYDGSVNLILNDGLNIPRLINTRFSVLENGLAKIPARRINDSNLYQGYTIDLTNKEQQLFDSDTSLNKRSDYFPVVKYNGVINNGNLKVGNYTLYFKYSDDDGNETDWIAESGIISVFKGNDSDPFSIDGGIEDMNAYKSISITLTNIDTSYHYIKVYYVRNSSSLDSTRIPQTYEILKQFEVDNNKCNIIITGDEETNQINISEINTQYKLVQQAKTQAQAQNLLFLGNVSEAETHYKDLTDLSLRVIPYVKMTRSKTKIGNISQKTYCDDSDPTISEDTKKHIFKNEYFNTKNIYYNVGYWNEEYYRLGIVYIYNNNSLSDVFNISGGIIEIDSPGVDKNNKEIDHSISKLEVGNYSITKNNICKSRNYIQLTEDNNYLDKDRKINSRGVIQILNKEEEKYTNEQHIFSLGVTLSQDLITYLREELSIKGFFIVRQKRIPTILCQGYTLPWDKEAKVPVIEYWGAHIPYTNNNRMIYDPKGTKDYYYQQCSDYLDNIKMGYFKDGFLYSKCYFVEGFLRQCSEDGLLVGLKNYGLQINNDNFLGLQVTHEYIPRLYNILPICIDSKMINYKNSNEITKYIRLTVEYSPIIDNIGDTETFWGTLQNAWNIFKSGLANTPTQFPKIKLDTNGNIIYDNNNKPIIEWYTRDHQYDKIICRVTTDGIIYRYFTVIDYQSIKNYINTINNLEVIEEYKASDIPITSPSNVSGNYLTALSDAIDNTSYKDIYMSSGIKYNHQLISSESNLQKIWTVPQNYNDIKIDSYIHPDKGYVTQKYYFSDQLVSLTTGTNAVSTPLVKSNINIGSYYVNRTLSTSIHIDSINKIEEYIGKHYYDLYKYCDGNQLVAICPEFEVRQPYFNTLFTGAEYTIKYTNYQQGILVRNENNERLYYSHMPKAADDSGDQTFQTKGKELKDFYYEKSNPKLTESGYIYNIVSVTDNVPVVAIGNTIFKSVIGSDAEAYRFAYINEEHCAKRELNTKNSSDYNLVRGIYSPYLGIVAHSTTTTEKQRGYCRTFNIYAKNYSQGNQLEVRFQNNAQYYQISERISISDLSLNSYTDIQNDSYIPELKKDNNEYNLDLYRGDCYICTFTHRLNRNFQDPTAPTNDSILDPATWANNYQPDTSGKDSVEKLNRINRGDINAVKLGSWITIKVKSSYNLNIRSLDESHVNEKGVMGTSRGFYPLQQATIQGGYKISNSYVINDGFGATVGEKYFNTQNDAAYIKNEFQNRILYSDVNVTDSFKNGYRIFRQSHYRDYTKQYGQIVKLVEIQSMLLVVFEHGVCLIPVNERALAAEGSGGNVFINTSNVLPETLKVLSDMYGSQWKDSIVKTPYYIYGVDAVAKKIWRTNGSQFQIISDFKVEKFLLENIPIGENDTEVTLGLKNISTHYNAGKSDVMFTLYYKKKIITKPAEYDKCGKTVTEEEQFIYDKDEYAWNLCYNEILQKFQTFYSWIPIQSANIDNVMYSFDRETSREILVDQEPEESKNNYINLPDHQKSEQPYVDFPSDRNTPYIWKHGPINNQKPYPCFWYGEQHPFEFEFIVNDQAGIEKIFDNLDIISNKAEPESFHFEVVGDSYDFKDDKPNIYVRQEATKELFSNKQSNVQFNPNYKKLCENNLEQQPKSTIFPWYYRCVNTYNDIYDLYTRMTGNDRNYCYLSGSEIKWHEDINDFSILTHIKNSPINGHWEPITKEEYDNLKDYPKVRRKKETRDQITFYYVWDTIGRMRGNSHYKEDRWRIQIPSITLIQSNEYNDYKMNESQWKHNVPPIIISSDTIPNDLTLDGKFVINHKDLPNVNSNSSDKNIDKTTIKWPVSTTMWTQRKEVRLRDKYIKIRVRYSGKDLAIISAIITTYITSFS